MLSVIVVVALIGIIKKRAIIINSGRCTGQPHKARAFSASASNPDSTIPDQSATPSTDDSIAAAWASAAEPCVGGISVGAITVIVGKVVMATA